MEKPSIYAGFQKIEEQCSAKKARNAALSSIIIEINFTESKKVMNEC